MIMRKSLVFLGIVALAAVAQAQEIEDFEYRTEIYNGNIGIAITGYKGKTKDIEIPALIRGFPVTVIDDGAFKNAGLTDVEIPGTVRKIGKESFTGNRLTGVVVPQNLTEIENDSFDSNLLVNVPELQKKLPKNRRSAAAAAQAAEGEAAVAEAPPAKSGAVMSGSGGFAPKPGETSPGTTKAVAGFLPAEKKDKLAVPQNVEMYFDEEEWEDYDEPGEIIVTNLELVGIESVPQERVRYRKVNGEWIAEVEKIDEPDSSYTGPEAYHPQAAAAYNQPAAPPPAYTPPPKTQNIPAQGPQAANGYPQAANGYPPAAAYNPPAAPYSQPAAPPVPQTAPPVPPAAYNPPAAAYNQAPQAYSQAAAPPAAAYNPPAANCPPAVYPPPSAYNQPAAAAPPAYGSTTPPQTYGSTAQAYGSAVPPAYGSAAAQTVQYPAAPPPQTSPALAAPQPAAPPVAAPAAALAAPAQQQTQVYKKGGEKKAAGKAAQAALTQTAGEWLLRFDGSFTSAAGYSGQNKILVIPFSVEGRRINGIAPDAFPGKSIQSVSFPSSITVIGERAFRSNAISDVVLPASVRVIGAAAFEGNPLYRIKIPACVELDATSFPAGFAAFYTSGGSRAGTYSFDGAAWSYVAFDKLAYDSM